jgi:tetratricopeptide (TPR) repeat protein
VEVETVAWIAELKNVESWLFYLLAVLGWIQFVDQPAPRRWPYYFLAALAYLLAMFAKTTACTLPAALVLVLWLRGERFTRWRALQLAPFLAVGLGMGLLTIWWEKHLGDYDESFGLSFGFTQRLLIASRALWFYAGKLLWPANLAFSYPRWNINPAEPWQYVPIVAGVVLALCLWLGRARIGRGVIAGIIFFVAALSPLIGFITEGTFHYTYVADHYQYNASIGLIAVFAALAWHYLGRSSFWRPLQAALLLLLVGLTWHQCAPYRNLETLWRDTLAKNPNSWMAHHNLGIEFFKAGQMDAALDQYRIAVTLYPQGDREQSDLGTALMEQGVYPEAIQHLEAALAINPKLFPAQNSLALAYSKTGDYDQAMAHFQQALQIQPDSLGVRLNLGSVLKRQGKLVEAAEDYRTAIKQFPSEVEPRRRLTAVLVQQGDFSQAADACREALQLSPTDSNLWLQLGNIFLAENNYAAAADGYRRALQIDPTSAGLHYNLGLVLGMQGQISLERQELMTALQLKPDFAPAQQELQSLNSSPAK